MYCSSGLYPGINDGRFNLISDIETNDASKIRTKLRLPGATAPNADAIEYRSERIFVGHALTLYVFGMLPFISTTGIVANGDTVGNSCPICSNLSFKASNSKPILAVAAFSLFVSSSYAPGGDGGGGSIFEIAPSNNLYAVPVFSMAFLRFINCFWYLTIDKLHAGS